MMIVDIPLDLILFMEGIRMLTIEVTDINGNNQQWIGTETESVLDGAQRNGVRIPNACKGGECGLCKIRDELEFNDKLIKGISQYLKDRKVNALVGQKSGKMIIFLSEDMLLKSNSSKKKFCGALHDFCSSKYPSHDFKIGISSSTARIEEASQLYEESTTSLQIANHYQKVVFFEFLGIEGIMFQMENDRL